MVIVLANPSGPANRPRYCSSPVCWGVDFGKWTRIWDSPNCSSPSFPMMVTDPSSTWISHHESSVFLSRQWKFVPSKTPHFAGRLYWVVNSVREILQVKDLQSLHQVNFPLTVRMQENPMAWRRSPCFLFQEKNKPSHLANRDLGSVGTFTYWPVVILVTQIVFFWKKPTEKCMVWSHLSPFLKVVEEWNNFGSGRRVFENGRCELEC